MFLSVRQCAEFMTRVHILKVNVTLQGHVIYPSIRLCYIYPKYFERFSLNFTQMFLSVRQCAEQMTKLPRVKVTGQGQGITFEFRVRSIYPESFERFSLNFTQVILSVRRCAEPITWPHRLRLKVKVTLQSHGIYPSIPVRSISPELLERFSLNFTQRLLSVRWSA